MISSALFLLGILADVPCAQAAEGGIPPSIRSLFEGQCYRCHGENGTNQGGLGSILDYENLISKNLVIPGHPEFSPLLQKIKSGEMPLGGPRLLESEQQLVEQWIAGLPPLPSATPSAVASHPAPILSNSQLPVLPAIPSVTANRGNMKRDGHYVEPTFTHTAVRSLQVIRDFGARVDGSVYAQLLYVEKGAVGRDVLIAVTETNGVYAFDADTGSPIWKRTLGPAVALSDLPCGNIDPLGITGTPAVDVASNTIVLDSMQSPDHGRTKRHLIYRLSVESGKTISGWPVDVSRELSKKGQIFNSENQNQRGAVAIVGGTAYLPYGGHFGDCGNYHGWIVGVPLEDPTHILSWKTGAKEGGIWAPGGISSDGNSLFFASGNTSDARQWSGGESIFSLPLSLQTTASAANHFTPTNWKQLDELDADLGGTAPILLDVPVTGGSGVPKFIAGFGKDGNAYIVNRGYLGGTGPALLTYKVSEGSIITQPTAFTSVSGTYVVVRVKGSHCPAGTSGDLTALRITATTVEPALDTAWCASQNGTGSPIVTTTDGHSDPIVWGLGAEGDGHLRGFDGETGKVLFDALVSTDLVRFQSPIVTKGRIFVMAGSSISVFSLNGARTPASTSVRKSTQKSYPRSPR